MKYFAFFLTVLLSTSLNYADHHGEGESEETKLGLHMDELSSTLKSLRRLDEGDWNGKVEVAQKAQEELLKCFGLHPKSLAKVKDEAEKAVLIAEYKKLLAENYAKLCELELAFLTKDEDLSDDILSALKKIKKKGHTKYIED